MIIFLQEEIEDVTGLYICKTPNSFITSIWPPVISVVMFTVEFLIPFIIFAHNYVRIGVTLYQSLKENKHLQEGINIQ